MNLSFDSSVHLGRLGDRKPENFETLEPIIAVASGREMLPVLCDTIEDLEKGKGFPRGTFH